LPAGVAQNKGRSCDCRHGDHEWQDRGKNVRMNQEQASSLAVKLATGTWTHDYGITAEEAKALGLPISSEMPAEVYEFMGLFAQPTRTRPSVEYVPMPYRGASSEGSSSGS